MMEDSTVERRRFLEIATGASMLAGVPSDIHAGDVKGQFPQRRLGHTGEMVSMVGLGGYHLARPNVEEAESIRIVRAAIDNGLNFLDNCWDYNDGQSEVRMGKALSDGYRGRAFLMTKIDARDAKTATMQLDGSLKRLQVDHLDLIQFHDVHRMDDPEQIFAPRGALEAMIKARTAGKVRY